MDWENHFEKNSIQKIEKTVKIKVKLPHVNKKPLARKRIFVQTPFSHSTLNLEQKISRRKTTRFFAPLPVSAWPKSLLQFDFKNHENVWTDLKKKPEELRKRLEVKIHLNAIQLLIKQNMPSLIYDYLETKSWNKKVKTIKSNLLKYDKKSDQILL